MCIKSGRNRTFGNVSGFFKQMFVSTLFATTLVLAVVAFEPLEFNLNRAKDSTINVNRDAVAVSTETNPRRSMIEMNVGSDNQTINFYIDDSSDLTYVIARGAVSSSYSDQFDYLNSTTFKRNRTASSFSFDDYYNVTGFWGQDDVTIVNQTIKGFEFGIVDVDYTSHGQPYGWPYGNLGLGFPKLNPANESTDKPESFLLQLKNQGIISKAAYSIHYTPHYGSDISNGTLLLGAVDHSKYSGTLNTLSLANYNVTGVTSDEDLILDQEVFDFQVLSKGVNFTTKPGSKEEHIVITDTTRPVALSYLDISYFPRRVYNAMTTTLGFVGSDSHEWVNSVSCPKDDTTAFVFEVGGTTISVPLSSLVRRHDDKCSFTVSWLPDDADYIILGHDVLQYAYMVYDVEDREISIAQVALSKASQIEEIVSLVPSAVRISTETSFSSDYGDFHGQVLNYKTISGYEFLKKKYKNGSKKVSLTWLMVFCGVASLVLFI